MSGPPPSPWGRRIVLGVFLAFAGSGGAVLFGNVLWQLYAAPPPLSREIPRKQARWCVQQLTGLRADLENRLTFELQNPHRGGSLARWQNWSVRWQERFATASERCAPRDSRFGNAYQTLEEIRDTYATGLEAVVRGRSALNRDLNTAMTELVRLSAP